MLFDFEPGKFGILTSTPRNRNRDPMNDDFYGLTAAELAGIHQAPKIESEKGRAQEENKRNL